MAAFNPIHILRTVKREEVGVPKSLMTYFPQNAEVFPLQIISTHGNLYHTVLCIIAVRLEVSCTKTILLHLLPSASHWTLDLVQVVPDSHKHRFSLRHHWHGTRRGRRGECTCPVSDPALPAGLVLAVVPTPLSWDACRTWSQTQDNLSSTDFQTLPLSCRAGFGWEMSGVQTFEMIIQIDNSLKETTTSGGAILHKPMICSRGSWTIMVSETLF